MALITARNLSLGYDSHIVVGNLNFTVEKGDYLCVVGENGSGKTTLMRAILGLNKPIFGTIERGDGLKATEIGYLPQQSDAQRDFPASVEEIVLSGTIGKLGIRPFYGSSERKMAVENMKKMGVDDLAKKSFRTLSGGQQQRVLLARALCATRKILLLDEPVSGLDPKVTEDMYHLIKDLNSDGIAVIMISHDIAAAARYATHVLHIGNTIFYGTTEDYEKSDIGKLFLRREDDGGKQDAGTDK